jgi:predicted transcriptional regulator
MSSLDHLRERLSELGDEVERPNDLVYTIASSQKKEAEEIVTDAVGSGFAAGMGDADPQVQISDPEIIRVFLSKEQRFSTR